MGKGEKQLIVDHHYHTSKTNATWMHATGLFLAGGMAHLGEIVAASALGTALYSSNSIKNQDDSSSLLENKIQSVKAQCIQLQIERTGVEHQAFFKILEENNLRDEIAQMELKIKELQNNLDGPD